MTAAIMQQCGAQVELSLQKNEIKIAPGAYRSAAYIRREGDWSAASFFYERSLLGGMQIKIKNLLPPSLTVQGDAAAARIWEQLGVTTTFTEQCEAILTPGGERVQTVEEDMSSVPDLVPPLVVSCCRASVPFTLTGIAALRLKESDRVQALCEGLLSLGYCVEADADTIYWNGNRAYAPTPTPTIDNKNDHRIAMAFAMGAPHPLLMPLTNRECVSKSFPDFWAYCSCEQ
jgi:3-phosphoshikimate 1-carboxyvinyltransferase